MIFLSKFWNKVSGTHLRLSPNYFRALNMVSQDMWNGSDFGSVRNLEERKEQGKYYPSMDLALVQ